MLVFMVKMRLLGASWGPLGGSRWGQDGAKLGQVGPKMGQVEVFWFEVVRILIARHFCAFCLLMGCC